MRILTGECETPRELHSRQASPLLGSWLAHKYLNVNGPSTSKHPLSMYYNTSEI